MDEVVQISRKEYLELFRASMELIALETAGVDNWEGYDEIDWNWVEQQVEKEEQARGTNEHLL